MSAITVLSMGWGVQSWTLAAMSALGELPRLDYVVHADTGHEAAKTYEHAAKWTPWLEERGIKVVTVQAPNTDVVIPGVTSERQSMEIPAFSLNQTDNSRGQIRRQCTNRWKIQPVRKFLRTLGPARPGAFALWMGISLDEWHRMKDSDVKYIRHVYPLVDGRITRSECVAWLEQHQLDIPARSSCVFCPYATKAEWHHRKQLGGADWDHAVEIDLAVRHQRPGYELFVHSSRLPLAQAVSIPEDHGATQLTLTESEPSCDSGYCFS
ncbi:MAG TPA: hypothetical protein VFR55_08400 [Dehalococcoidia bacterium]|nr:hypothetical protein [Dehalococcoidia bacterium]